MKTLLLLRHAKSSWANDDLADYDRPLNERGRGDAPRMGRLIRREGLTPELIVSSSAKRAAATAELVALELPFDGELRYTERLYLAEPWVYIDIARQTADDVAMLMLVGHNPGIEELVEHLTGESVRMATAALAFIRLPVERWGEVAARRQYELTGFWRPKEL